MFNSANTPSSIGCSLQIWACGVEKQALALAYLPLDIFLENETFVCDFFLPNLRNN